MARAHITVTELSPWLFDGGPADTSPEFLAKIAEHDTALDALEAGAGAGYIDLRAAPYSLVAGSTTLAQRQANTAGMRLAITTFAGTTADLKLPPGETYFEADLTTTNACIKLGPGVTDLTISGWGMYASTAVMYAESDLGELDLFVLDGTQRIELCHFGIRQDEITNPDPGQQNHGICFYNTVLGGTMRDNTFHSMYFGKHLGDAVRFVAVDSGDKVINTRGSNFVMELAGTVSSTPANGRTGARSGIAMQRGGEDTLMSNFYIRGMQNSAIDEEPSGGTGARNAYRNFVIDNRISNTVSAISLGGASVNAFSDGRLSDGMVLGGQVNMLGASVGYKLERLHIETTSPTPSGPTEALILIRSSGGVGHTNLELNDITVRRTGTSGNGGCIDITNNGNRTTLRNVTLTQGVNGYPITVIDSSRTTLDNTYISFEGPNPASFNAVLVQAIGANMDQLYIRNLDVHVPSGAAMGSAVRFDQRNPRTMTNIRLSDIRYGSNCTTGAYFSYDTGGGTADKTPHLEGFTAAVGTNTVWTQVDQNDNPVTNVFPIIAGSRGSVCHHVGVSTPESALTAVQGTRYTQELGDATNTWIKQSGSGTNTGWRRLTGASITVASISGTQNNYAPSGIDTAEVLLIPTSGIATITGMQLTTFTDGYEVYLANTSANVITLTHEDALSTAANRFALPGAVSATIASAQVRRCRYIAASSRWVLVS